MKLRVLVFLVAVTAPLPIAFAWFGEGHMAVAEIAWKHLNATSRTRVSALLKLNPDYDTWTAGVSEDAKDQTAFVAAATWPDAIKGKPCKKGVPKNACYTNDGDTPPDSPVSGQNIGYADHLQHRYWHFVDTPFSTDGTGGVQPKTPNAETQILLFEAALAAVDTSDDVKSYDLVWLEHMVGDVHQPLHATSRFSADLPDGDRGGNSVLVAPACAKTCPKELHAVWDNALGGSDKPGDAIAVADELPGAPADAAAITDVHAWIAESFAAAKQFAYASPIGPGTGPFTLDAHYNRAVRKEARTRVELAGAHLANLINSSLQ